MKLIVGLGNPGREYQDSRHNIGFVVIDRLARKWAIDMSKKKYHGLCGRGRRAGEQVFLLKPQTYMNHSGDSVVEAMNYYRLDQADLLVILDDMALQTGHLRLRALGSAGGHNGLQNIIEKLGENEFGRLRIGIGPAETGQAVGHVLGRFLENELPVIDQAVSQAIQAVECWLAAGIQAAMNRFNIKQQNGPD